jgi:hypothetical protein
VSSIFKNVSRKTFGPHCVYLTNHAAMCLAGVEVCLGHKLVQVDGGMSVCYKLSPSSSGCHGIRPLVDPFSLAHPKLSLVVCNVWSVNVDTRMQKSTV